MSEDAGTVQQDPEVEAALETIKATIEEIRPAIQFDGGDLSFVDFSPDTGVVSIEMHGACTGCSLSSTTLQAGIERIVRERVPLVKAVVNVGETFF